MGVESVGCWKSWFQQLNPKNSLERLNKMKYKLKIQSSESKPKQSNKKQFICFCLIIFGISGCVVGGTANLYPEYNNKIIIPTGFVSFWNGAIWLLIVRIQKWWNKD